MLEDFFFCNAIHITIVRPATVGNGPLEGLWLPKSIRGHINTVTISNLWENGAFEARDHERLAR